MSNRPRLPLLVILLARRTSRIKTGTSRNNPTQHSSDSLETGPSGMQGCSVPDRVGPCQTVVWPCRTVPGRPGPQTPHFYWPVQPPNYSFFPRTWVRPAPQLLTFIDRARAARPQTPHFYNWPTPHFCWPDPSLPVATPSLLPHCNWPDPSLLFARPDQAIPDSVGSCWHSISNVPDHAMPVSAVSA